MWTYGGQAVTMRSAEDGEVLFRQTGFPHDGIVGRVMYDPDSNVLYVGSGSAYQIVAGRGWRIDRRTMRHPGYLASQQAQAERGGSSPWIKTFAGRQAKHRGLDRCAGTPPWRPPPTTRSTCLSCRGTLKFPLAEQSGYWQFCLSIRVQQTAAAQKHTGRYGCGYVLPSFCA
jgi:hypothetical protein